MLGAVATALTVGRNFAPWFAGVAIAAAIAGAGGAWWLAGLYHAERVADARRDEAAAEGRLAAFRAELGTAVAEGEAAGAARVVDALREQREGDRRVAAAVGAIPAEVARILAPELTDLRRTLDDPRFGCLDLPLPDAALGVLRRPGGRAGAADGGRGPDGG